MLGHPVHVYRNSDYLPAVAIAASVLVAQGEIGDYTEFTDTLQGSDNCVRYDRSPQTSSGITGSIPATCGYTPR